MRAQKFSVKLKGRQMGFADSGYGTEKIERPPLLSSGGCVEFTFTQRVLLAILLNEEIGRTEGKKDKANGADVEKLKTRLCHLHCMLSGVNGTI